MLLAADTRNPNTEGECVLTDIYLIRHAAPDRSQRIDYHTPPGPDLTAQGREEARQAAAFLAERGLEQLYVSPFARTHQTADVLVATLQIPVTFTSLVAEHAVRESVEQVRARVGELLHSLDQGEQRVIGIVSHGSPIKEMLLLLTEGRVQITQTFPQGNPAPTAGIWHVQRSAEDGQWHATLIFQPLELL
jgi:2,3-bisphosphoglycerate-dependent phosphoglycerate mutase